MDAWGGEGQGEPEWVEDVIEIVDKDAGGARVGDRDKTEVAGGDGVWCGDGFRTGDELRL